MGRWLLIHEIMPEYTNYWGSTFDIEPKPTKKVTRYTRAGYGGRNIFCPKCDKRSRVYHFAWSALGCTHCGSMIDKYEWKLL